jgi:glycine cleavage system T protein
MPRPYNADMIRQGRIFPVLIVKNHYMPFSPLSADHTAAGAAFTDIAGWAVPAHYGDAGQEHRAVRTGAGLMDLSYRGKLRMTGKDRQGFLHRIVTNDINGLKPGEGAYACLLTPQGKIVADMTVYLRDEEMLLDLEPGMAPALRTNLDRYALIDDVVMEDVTEQVGLIGVHGPRAAPLLDALLGACPELPMGGHAACAYENVSMLLARSHRTGEAGYDLWVPADRAALLWSALIERGKAFGARRVGYEALETLRVEAGIPRYGAELDDRIIPNEAVKERAVSFTKGCYIGQEPVVMMEHRGRPNRLLAGLKIRGTILPARGAILRKEDQEAGWIATAVRGRSVEGVIALGFVRRKFMQAGNRLTVETDGRTAEAEIADLPFYPPRGNR